MAQQSQSKVILGQIGHIAIGIIRILLLRLLPGIVGGDNGVGYGAVAGALPRIAGRAPYFVVAVLELHRREQPSAAVQGSGGGVPCRVRDGHARDYACGCFGGAVVPTYC